jgi:hypothetical protein
MPCLKCNPSDLENRLARSLVVALSSTGTSGGLSKRPRRRGSTETAFHLCLLSESTDLNLFSEWWFLSTERSVLGTCVAAVRSFCGAGRPPVPRTALNSAPAHPPGGSFLILAYSV